MIDASTRQELHRRLEASRAALLETLADVTDRDFISDLGGETVVQLLARVAAEERRAAARAEGGDYSPRAVERPMPPQAIHALAGARYRTRRYVDAPGADEATARGLVEAAERRESDAAARIKGRPELPPLPAPDTTPEIPMIPPDQARRA